MTLEGRNYMRRVLSDKEMKDAWKERFKKERKKKYARQEDFAEAMQHEGHATMKSTVGRWENIGGSYGKEIPGFPSFPTMQSISKLLDVQIGYLIGETDARSFDVEEVMGFFGLSEEAVNCLSDLAHRQGANHDRFSEKYGDETTSYADTLNKVLTSKSFLKLISHLNELDCLIREFEDANSHSQRNQREAIKEKAHCLKHGLSPESTPERFDEGGHLIDESGFRLFDPDNPERLADEVLRVRDQVRINKCLLIDDQMALVREIWPQTIGYEDSIANLDDVIVKAADGGCRCLSSDSLGNDGSENGLKREHH